jgi:hypothetical protein
MKNASRGARFPMAWQDCEGLRVTRGEDILRMKNGPLAEVLPRDYSQLFREGRNSVGGSASVDCTLVERQCCWERAS